MLAYAWIFLYVAVMSQNIVYDKESANDTTSIDNQYNRTVDDDTQFHLLENYYPILVMLVSMSRNDTDCLEKYLNQRTYAELKRMIDQQQQQVESIELFNELEGNTTQLAALVQAEDTPRIVNIIQAYHNASIYNVIRGVWNAQLEDMIPAIDQLAILEYFSERRASEESQMTFWSRLVAAIRAWIDGKNPNEGTLCYADKPQSIRRLVETLPTDTRNDLEEAAKQEQSEIVENIVLDQVSELPAALQTDFKDWMEANEPPKCLKTLIDTVPYPERLALSRLRASALIHTLKDYYRTVIETMHRDEQEEIRTFFQRMNETFAACYNPSRGKYEFY